MMAVPTLVAAMLSFIISSLVVVGDKPVTHEDRSGRLLPFPASGR
jgi:hypothetical protein